MMHQMLVCKAPTNKCNNQTKIAVEIPKNMTIYNIIFHIICWATGHVKQNSIIVKSGYMYIDMQRACLHFLTPVSDRSSAG